MIFLFRNLGEPAPRDPTNHGKKESEESSMEQSQPNEAVGAEAKVASEEAKENVEMDESEIAKSESSRPATPWTPGPSTPGPSTAGISMKDGKSKSLMSKDYKEVMRQLNVRYKKNVKGEKPTAMCSKCSQKIVCGGSCCMLVQHAMTHMKSFAFMCKLCHKEHRYYSAWYQHFQNCHRDARLAANESNSGYTDYYVDNRREVEPEIIQELKQCFLIE